MINQLTHDGAPSFKERNESVSCRWIFSLFLLFPSQDLSYDPLRTTMSLEATAEEARNTSDTQYDTKGSYDNDENTKGAIEGGALPDIAAADLLDDGTLDPIYQAKARVLNDAMQEIGASRSGVALSDPTHMLHWSSRDGVLDADLNMHR